MNNQKLLEVVAGIAYQAGRLNLFTGDSRADVSEFIRWAEHDTIFTFSYLHFP